MELEQFRMGWDQSPPLAKKFAPFPHLEKSPQVESPLHQTTD